MIEFAIFVRNVFWKFLRRVSLNLFYLTLVIPLKIYFITISLNKILHLKIQRKVTVKLRKVTVKWSRALEWPWGVGGTFFRRNYCWFKNIMILNLNSIIIRNWSKRNDKHISCRWIQLAFNRNFVKLNQGSTQLDSSWSSKKKYFGRC